jgi:hypothetical protein
MVLTLYIGDDRAIYFHARPEFLDGQDGRPLGEGPLERVGPGEELAGRTFEEWRQFLKARGGVARVKS